MISRAQINGIKDWDVRTILLGMYDQHIAVGAALGINLLSPTNSQQKPASSAPPSNEFSVSGDNGVFTIEITNTTQAINKTIYHELSYSPSANFSSQVATLPVSTSTHQTLPSPGLTVYWRLRSSYDKANWNVHIIQPGVVESGLQSSAASSNNVPLNQTNYANIDSVSVGATANVRIYGKAGPTTQYPSVKGATETIEPSATIINVPLSSNQVVALDAHTNYQVRVTLPEVFADGFRPVGAVSVVGGGSPTLPTVSLVLGAGGAVVGWNVTSQGNGLTGNVTLVIVTGTGSGATPGVQTISAGKLISISPGNPGSGYVGGDTVTVSGGIFSGGMGGGQSIGGNNGRFVYNDGTLGG
jgi:hypothetical protein